MLKTNPIKKTLSICLAGRNDNYGGNFIQRLSLSINFLSENAAQIGKLDDLEVVVTDWNSRNSLVDALNLTHCGASICRFISVPPEIAEPKNFSGTNFHSTLAVNVALRRAKGNFVMFSPADSLFTSLTLSRLFSLLSGEITTPFDPKEVGMIISRKHLPTQFDKKKAYYSLDFTRKYLAFNETFLDRGGDLCGQMSGAGALIVHHTMLRNTRGFDEQLGGWGASDIDFGLRINLKYPIVNLSSFGLTIYDFETSPKLQQVTDKRKNIYKYFHQQINSENWGLGRLSLHEQMAENKPSAEISMESVRTYDVKSINAATVKKLAGATLRQITANNLHHKVTDVPAFYFPLTWFALHNKCYKYLELGTSASYASLIISSINPCAEIYCAPSLSKTITNANDAAYLIKLSRLLTSKKHKGITRFIPGDPGNSLKRLKESFIGTMYFDLVVLDTASFENSLPEQLQQILEYIPVGGALIINGHSVSALAKVIDFMKDEQPSFSCLICRQHNVCLFINRKTDFSIIDEQSITKAWRPLKRKSFPLYLAYLCNLLIKMSLQLLFLDYRLWPARILSFISNAKRDINSFTRL